MGRSSSALLLSFAEWIGGASCVLGCGSPTGPSAKCSSEEIDAVIDLFSNRHLLGDRLGRMHQGLLTYDACGICC